jgi:8-oxo-dGTP pyrophosphatase MutT (NUDIX family)
MEPGKTAGDIALQEAWEEAGLLGELADEPLGSYSYEKAGNRYRVTVFLMRVAEVKNDWPEKGKRSRAWVSPVRALERIQEFGLRTLIRQAASRVTADERLAATSEQPISLPLAPHLIMTSSPA